MSAGREAPGATAQDWRAGVRASRSKQLLVLVLTALLVAVGAYLVGQRTDAGKGGGEGGMNGAQAVTVTGDKAGPPPEVGKPAQDFTVKTVDGKTLSLSGLRGRPVWLTFGASWCTACRSEAPDVQAAYEQAKASGLEIVSVGMQESPADISAYARRLGLTFPQVADPDTALASRYRVMGLPSHFFVDEQGVLRATHIGALTRSAMTAELAKIGA